MSDKIVNGIIIALAVPAVLIGAGVLGLVIGIWFDWPIADWIWSMLP